MDGWVEPGFSGLPPPTVPSAPHVWRNGCTAQGSRALAEETAVAFTYNGATHAVMMATPDALEDFAIGFSITEGIIEAASEIDEITVTSVDAGIDLRIWLREDRADRLAERRRRLAGPVGCGMCGLETLAQTRRDLPHAPSGMRVTAADVLRATAALSSLQVLNRRTHSLHAAAFWDPVSREIVLREDVGRHNALDKVAGALARAGVPAASGVLLTTSRLSVELLQKAAMIGAPIIVGVSAPTALAMRAADAAGITLIGIARPDGFEIFTRPDRVDCGTEV